MVSGDATTVRLSLNSRRRSLSSASSSEGSNEKDPAMPPLSARGKKHGGDYTPDKCKVCMRQFTKLLQCKQCYLCKNVVCALCSLKIPMFHSMKSILGKHSLHARLCATCYDTNVLNQNSTDSPDGDATIDDDGETLILVDDSNDPCDPPVPHATKHSRTSLWLSVFMAAIMLELSILEGIEYEYRTAALVTLFIVFVGIHPSLSHAFGSTPPSRATPSNNMRRRSSAISQADSSDSNNTELTEDDYRQRKAALSARFEELKVSTAWVKNENKSTAAVTLYEMDCGELQPIFKADAFIPETSMDDMLAFLSSADPKVRRKWDTGMADNEVVETVDVDGHTLSVIHNTQKPHGFGLVSSRDFVLLAFAHSPTAYVQGVLERPDVPIKAGVMRGQVHFISYELVPSDEPKGFHMTYINHVEIGGSIPKKLVSNGTADNVVKMMNMCIQSKKKWF
ncbi:Aste57867_24683 [Aphanomyces stellatus]|uniref:Aste57867_24683 protein n=1 Tax=Aphanomyces stellatus TaxID=120398 RepID=A0A485LR59_9STRA|nr:hypothetical protein As57867_024605 [Aphanomyces stellatus]VFU01320.1 Aste57867_24683 [Aphanomyces stellatus]